MCMFKCTPIKYKLKSVHHFVILENIWKTYTVLQVFSTCIHIPQCLQEFTYPEK